MDEQALVSVRGEAVMEVEPEIAVVDVAVGARDKDRDRTVARLDERAGAVRAVLASFGTAVERTETAALRIAPELKDGRGHERVAGYAGTLRHTVTVVDFTVLGDLMARLAELEMVDVLGPWWRLAPRSTVHADARMAAAREAVSRAAQYAAALGSRVVALVELADTGLMSEAVHGRPAPMGAMAVAAPSPGGMRAGAAAPVSFDVEPVRQVVRASVEARFRITQPAPEALA
jgi:uncharacterized protein